MAHFDLRCRDCNQKFVVITRAAIRQKQKVCPTCGSGNVRQTLGSYLQNGPLSDPNCGAPQRNTGYG
jgi:putative FmdB family regulatory protein